MNRAEIFQSLREQRFESQPEVIQHKAQQLPALVQRLAETSLRPGGVDTALQKAANLLQENRTVILGSDWREQGRNVQIDVCSSDEIPLDSPRYSPELDILLDPVGDCIRKQYNRITYYLDIEFGNKNLLITLLKPKENYILGKSLFGNIKAYRTDGVFSKIMLVFARILGTSFKKETVSRGLEDLKEKITSRFQPLEQPTYTNKEIDILSRIEELQKKLRA